MTVIRTEEPPGAEGDFVRSAAVVDGTADGHRVDVRSGHHPLSTDEPGSAGRGGTATTPLTRAVPAGAPVVPAAPRPSTSGSEAHHG
ncbi:hypothetical protein ACFCX4_29215 [Kitasatospora sp. NPDC056327]|uniref:hypothetical protein n=1 Tax=Kitasatospora sp. NPDC056327 TaxID=3345785 RepID=UPI0035DE4619